MATMILLPDGTGVTSAQWVVVGAATRNVALESDDGATSYVKCSTDGRTMNITYANPDDVTSVNDGVAEADITFIQSVRFLSSGRGVHRTDPSLVDIDFQAPSGNATQICSYDAHRTNFETINGNTQIFSDGVIGGTAWT